MSDRDLPTELPRDQWPDRRVVNLAGAAACFAWKRAQLPGMPIVRWFGPGGPLGQLDEVRDHIWLNTELAANEGELIKTIGHETHHATEYHAHTRFDCKAAEYGGDRFLEVWNRYIGDLHAKAAASGIAREPFQRLPFPGDASFDAAFDSHADVTVEARRPQAARAEFGFERGGAP